MDCLDLPWRAWSLPELNNWERSRSPNKNPKLWLSACRRRNFYSFGPHCLDPILQKRVETPDNLCRTWPPQRGWPGAQMGQDWPALEDKKTFCNPYRFNSWCSLGVCVCFPFCPHAAPAFSILAKYVALPQGWVAKSKEESSVHLCTPETFVAVKVVVP